MSFELLVFNIFIILVTIIGLTLAGILWSNYSLKFL